MRARVLMRAEEVAPLQEAWDALAVANARPLSAPGWLMPWWRTLAPAGALLRVVAVEEDGELVGLAPFFAERARGLVRYRPLGAGMSVRGTPLAAAGREREVAAAIGRALADATPRPGVVHLQQVDADSPWPALLAGGWPGRVRPRLERERTAPAPVMHLAQPSYEEWMAARSGNFRQRARRDRRRLEGRGLLVRLAGTPAELDAALAAFHALHRDRWGERSPLSTDAGLALMREAGRELPLGRFRVYSLEIDGAPVSVQVFVAAGGEVAYWNGGWDPRWAGQSPAIQGILAGVEDAFGRGERRIDLGEDDHAYKQRLADADAPIAWFELMPVGPAYALARAGTVPRHARPLVRRALDRLPPDARRRLEAARTRLRALRSGG